MAIASNCEYHEELFGVFAFQEIVAE